MDDRVWVLVGAAAQAFAPGHEGGRMLAWGAVAFGLWIIMSAATRGVRGRSARLLTATLSWVVARLVIWAAPWALHQIRPWFG